ncbi:MULTISPECIES: phospho-N-acetylmuramoyl-pentapeptide-transferase [Microbacterium]|uniref:Phospho-N-acetylmuramoyl-pentapeptide-transferase n=1 Tax=Microbacterium wangchenii TaxID=2541726 RepID=A0ABX5SQN0_9MICO|nr:MULTISPECIES: phospho-N-acetylmuramoyl-pentapeptide-transferase [Microbacterium]MCK6064983.1 phospho-N-acetylmuramoyl-pentapeptide-transferase [Microbacterium sp. EYE_512]QBR88456.1 phospho-N-acetylmuramoyl-pentapeptide-transferase [Microbacterium wangchenii]TFV82491.1 phospho-N-acetylmuramoyl-pentapeptide-transferase [Microbacterium sp. dk485]TXK20183.1 phospho-N-acetylmuramoyl-pentapeptide-transferase [Microbacterium wangchenii]
MRSLLTAAAISLAFTLFLTPVFLRLFRKWGWGQVIRTPEDIHNPSHAAKRGTPTMGGTIFIVGTIVGYLVGTFTGNNPPTISGWLVIWMMVGFGTVGFIDDFMKVRSQRSLGLSGWRKIVGQVIVTIPFGIVALNFPNRVNQTPASEYISVFRDIPLLSLFALGPILGWLLYLAWVSFIGVAASNSVNVTDGLDGLAAGSGIFVTGAYSLIAFWQVQQVCTNVAEAVQPACYNTRDPFDLAIVSAAFVGALVGFLWWNAPKAKVFMGDCGSMAIGGVIAAMAILTRTELLLVLVAGVYVIASGSVILQRAYFKITRGKRLFLMSPLHHHLEMRGWSEVTIVVRMWIIAGMLAVSGVGFFYVEWLSRA